MRCAVIMAGGKGTRLYPLSTEERPKQFLRIFGGKSLIELTYERLKKIIDADNIYIVMPKKYVHFISELIPSCKKDNVIVEEEQRSTGPCLLLANMYLMKRYPNEEIEILVSPADNYITDEKAFVETMDVGYRYLGKNDSIIIFGMTPTSPETRYGYVHYDGEQEVAKVLSFKEKPDLETAQKYLAEKNYLWNSGMFLYRAQYMDKLFKKYMRHDYDLLTSSFSNYHLCEDIAIDYAIMEKCDNINVVKSDFGWNDVGVFPALLKFTDDVEVLAKYRDKSE